MAESCRHEKAPERRCELFRWVVAIPWCSKPQKRTKRYRGSLAGVDPDIRRVFEGSTWSSFRLVIEAPDGVQVLREELLTEGR